MEGGVKSHFKRKHCSPKKTNTNYSCLSTNSIRKIAKAINKIPGITIKTRKLSDKQLYNKICRVMENNFNCKNEACWLKIQKLLKHLSKKDVKYFRKHFRPHMPKEIVDDYSEWISNFDIESVLKQYHEERDDFYFYGAVPIDFNKCSVSDLCKIDIHKHLKHGQNKLGVVFNTDKSNKPGKHWISMYVDIVGQNLNGTPGIYFFDSFAKPPGKAIKKFITKILDFMYQKKYNSKFDSKMVTNRSNKLKDFDITYNKVRHQYKSSECGVYSINFILRLLKGDEDFHDISTNVTKDDEVNACRDVYFNNYKK